MNFYRRLSVDRLWKFLFPQAYSHWRFVNLPVGVANRLCTSGCSPDPKTAGLRQRTVPLAHPLVERAERRLLPATPVAQQDPHVERSTSGGSGVSTRCSYSPSTRYVCTCYICTPTFI